MKLSEKLRNEVKIPTPGPDAATCSATALYRAAYNEGVERCAERVEALEARLLAIMRDGRDSADEPLAAGDAVGVARAYLSSLTKTLDAVTGEEAT